MKTYINQKTGAVLETNCTVSGGDWKIKKAAKKKKEKDTATNKEAAKNELCRD